MAISAPTRSSGSDALAHACEDQRTKTVRRTVFRSACPENGEPTKSHAERPNDEVNDAIAAAHDRLATLLRRAARLCRERSEDLACFMVIEMGKRSAEAHDEIELCARIFECYADLVEQPLQRERIRSPAGDAPPLRDPLGVVNDIQPGSLPFHQDSRFAAPNLMAGNVVLLKHASSIQQCAEAAEELLRDADGARVVERAGRTVKKTVHGLVESDPFVVL